MEPTARTKAKAERTDGTQAIARAVLLLRLMARRGIEGSRLSDLTKAAGIPHPTVRRILKCLLEERLAIQNVQTRRYVLGPMNFELGLAAEYRLDFRRKLRPTLERLAYTTGDTVYLSAQSGSEAVCLDRVEGHSPIRAVTLEVGGRRPLSFGAGGQALMARLSDEDVDRILAANAKDIANHARLTAESLKRAIQRARENGYAVIRDPTVVGVSAIGTVFDNPGFPTVSVSFAMVNERLTPPRARQLYQLLKSELSSFAKGDAATARANNPRGRAQR